MSDTFPLLLKEGWPDYLLNKLQILIPAGVVDCLFIFWIFSFGGFSYLFFFTNSSFLNTSLIRKNQRINHPGREIKYCIYMIINRPDAIPEAWLFAKFAHRANS
jgi:hypothetical protein